MVFLMIREFFLPLFEIEEINESAKNHTPVCSNSRWFFFLFPGAGK